MDILVSIGLILLSLSILVVVHELGHYWAARIFKIRVETFALFFGKKLFGFKRGDTEWRVNIIPLGGYVKISGMIDESLDEKQVEGEPQPYEFRSKPIWQRLIVMLGGIFMNVVLGCIIFIGHKYFVGDVVIPMTKLSHGISVADTSLMHAQGFRTGDQILNYSGTVYENLDQYADPSKLVDNDMYFEVKHLDGKVEKISLPHDFLNQFQESKEGLLFRPDNAPIVHPIDPSDSASYVENGVKPEKIGMEAYRAGLRLGDKVVRVDSTPIERYSQLHKLLKANSTKPLVFYVERNGKEIAPIAITPKDSMFGIREHSELLYDTLTYSFGEAIPLGISQAFKEVGTTLKSLRALFTGKANPAKSMSGPIGIAGIMGKGFQAGGGWSFFWRLTGMLSMVLAIMNLLPIPALDGGHVVILLIEAVIGREIPQKTKIIIMNIGVYMVIALMAFVFLNDIIKLF